VPLAAKKHLPTDIIRGNSMLAASKATRLSAQHLRRHPPAFRVTARGSTFLKFLQPVMDG